MTGMEGMSAMLSVRWKAPVPRGAAGREPAGLGQPSRRARLAMVELVGADLPRDGGEGGATVAQTTCLRPLLGGERRSRHRRKIRGWERSGSGHSLPARFAKRGRTQLSSYS